MKTMAQIPRWLSSGQEDAGEAPELLAPHVHPRGAQTGLGGWLHPLPGSIWFMLQY